MFRTIVICFALFCYRSIALLWFVLFLRLVSYVIKNYQPHSYWKMKMPWTKFSFGWSLAQCRVCMYTAERQLTSNKFNWFRKLLVTVDRWHYKQRHNTFDIFPPPKWSKLIVFLNHDNRFGANQQMPSKHYYWIDITRMCVVVWVCILRIMAKRPQDARHFLICYTWKWSVHCMCMCVLCMCEVCVAVCVSAVRFFLCFLTSRLCANWAAREITYLRIKSFVSCRRYELMNAELLVCHLVWVMPHYVYCVYATRTRQFDFVIVLCNFPVIQNQNSFFR